MDINEIILNAPVSMESAPTGPQQPTSATIVARFIAGTGETFSSNELTNWLDQSGNAYHATQTGTNGPKDETHANSIVAWDEAKGRPVLDDWHSTNGYMNLHASQPTSLRNFAFLGVVRRNSNALHQANDVNGTAIGLGLDANNMLWANQKRIEWWAGGSSAGIGSINVPPPTTPLVIGIRGHASGTDFVIGDRLITSATILPNSNFTGGTLGRGISAGYGLSHAAHEFVFLTGCDQATFTAWARHLQYKWDGNGTTGAGTGRKTRTLVIVGDSTAAGEPWYASNPIIGEQIAGRNPQAHVLSMAINSTTVGTTGGNHVDQQISQASGWLASTLATGESANPYQNRICLIMGGTNDIYFGSSAATVKAALTARVSEAKTAGATHVAVCTIMDASRNDAGMTTVRNAVNADIKNLASGIGHDICVNLHETANGGDDRFNDATANTDSVFADNVHPSYFGSTVLSQLIETQLASVLL